MTFWVAGAIVVGSVASASAANKAASVQANAANQAAAAQTAAANRAADLQYQMWQEQKALQEPWRAAGVRGLNALVPEVLNYKPFSQEQFQAEPGYAFRMSEGLKGLERSAAARGGLLSGSTLKNIQRFGQDLASQEYQNAFNRYQAERSARLQPLQSLAGVGQTAAQTLSGEAGSYGANVGNLYQNAAAAQAAGLTGAAQARASGYVGAANALTSALNTGLGYYQNQAFLNRLPVIR